MFYKPKSSVISYRGTCTGCAGLQPTVAAIKAGKDICLANKETLIAGGPYVLPLAREHGVNILPADSEHSVRPGVPQGSKSLSQCDFVPRLCLSRSPSCLMDYSQHARWHCCNHRQEKYTFMPRDSSPNVLPRRNRRLPGLLSSGNRPVGHAASAPADIRTVLPRRAQAIFQCLQGLPEGGMRRIILTASGGAFRDWPVERLQEVTAADAVKHPNWRCAALRISLMQEGEVEAVGDTLLR